MCVYNYSDPFPVPKLKYPYRQSPICTLKPPDITDGILFKFKLKASYKVKIDIWGNENVFKVHKASLHDLKLIKRVKSMKEVLSYWFQHNGAPCHTANQIVRCFSQTKIPWVFDIQGS